MTINEGVSKGIASFYRDDSDTVFLTIYVPILYLPTFSESNAWDFHLMTEISGNVPATSEDFPKTFRRLPNVAENVRTYFEDVWALPKLLTRALISVEHKNDTKSSFNAFLDWIFLFLSCVKEEFVRICESGVRNCPWCVRSMSLVHTRETHA